MAKVKLEFDVPDGLFCSKYCKGDIIQKRCKYIGNASNLCTVFGRTPEFVDEYGTQKKLKECLSAEIRDIERKDELPL